MRSELLQTERVNWPGKLAPNGYGRYGAGRYAHQVAHDASFGKPARGFEVDHLCRNRACCNPDHLEAVPKKVNILRGESPPARNARKIRCDRGHSLLSDGDVWIDARGHRWCRRCRRFRYRQNATQRGLGLPSEAKKTHCPAGHLYDAANTYRNKRGHRLCRACNRERARRRKV